MEKPAPEDMPLHRCLREARPAPPLPPRFAESVWRRIETAEAREPRRPRAWLDELLLRLLRPRILAAATAALVLMSTLAGLVEGKVLAREAAQARYLASVAPVTLR